MSTIDPIPLTSDAVAWLDALARAPGYISANELQPCECFKPLIWFGLVEQLDASFRLTDLGRWALTLGMIEDVGPA